MSITTIAVTQYADFTATIEAFTEKGIVFWYSDSTPIWTALFVAFDFKFCVITSGRTTQPASFNTDFPAAIHTQGPLNAHQYDLVI
jgi:hypothetical protein